MAKFKGKYRIESSRLKNWDYGRNAFYFITICTLNREKFFGDVASGEMILNVLGVTAENLWIQIENEFPFIKLHSFQIMPNHIHGILEIKKTKEHIREDVDIRKFFLYFEGGGFAQHKNPMFHNNLSRVIRWFKGRTTFELRKIKKEFSWQKNFHDSIIWNENQLKNVENYIINNPKNWKDDEFYL